MTTSTAYVEPRTPGTLGVDPSDRKQGIGAIPFGWEAHTIGELEQRGDIKLLRGKVISQKDIDRVPGDYPIYSSSVHSNGLFGCHGHYMFDEELITWSVDGGGHFFHRPKHRFSVTNVCGYLRIRTSSIDYRYLAYHLQHLHSRKVFDYTLKAHPSVIRGAYIVALPTIAEQRAIAEALADADGLLGALGTLITKKRDIKQTAMQQLLTGKTRLPGFSAEWEIVALDDVAARITGFWGASASSALAPHPVKVIRAGDISPLGALTGFAERYFGDEELAKARCKPGDVIITVSGNGLGKTWLVDDQSKLAASNFVRIIRAKAGRSHGPFIAAALNSQDARRLLAERTATSAYPNLRPSFFAVRWLQLPPFDEQLAIATILSEMDAEIAVLERRRQKTGAIKQGTMQQLLTGRVRLVKPPLAETSA